MDFEAEFDMRIGRRTQIYPDMPIFCRMFFGGRTLLHPYIGWPIAQQGNVHIPHYHGTTEQKHSYDT